jgi:phosphoglucomutase
VLQFFLKDGSKITMRPSGTEPKIKFYFSVHQRVEDDDIDILHSNLERKIDLLTENLLEKVNAL